MVQTTYRSRVHILAAREAPIIVVLQRKRAKLFHVITIDTQTHEVSEGSWFRGVIYALQSDVSFDGKFMVYLARGKNRQTWSGVCHLPWLKTLVHVEAPLTGGGYFAGPKDLRTHGWDCSEHVVSSDADIPFAIKRDEKRHFGYELAVIHGRLERDGFVRLGDNWGDEEEFTTPRFRVVCTGDDGWGRRPGPAHPQLTVRYTGFYDSGFRFEFALEGYSHIIEGASWVTWDAGNNLWVAKPGIVEQYTLDDLRNGTPSYSLDLDQFEPPQKPAKEP